MEHKLSKLKHFQQITLTDEERAYLRGSLAQVVSAPAPVREPLFMRGMQHGLQIALSSFLFVIFVGGSMAAVAAKALPGDDLYGFKLSVNEGVKRAFLDSPEEKVAYAQNRVSSRVKEIKTLAQSKTLTKEKQAIAQKALDDNIKDLSTQLTTLSDKSPSAALSVTANLEQNLKQDKEAIKSTLGTDTTDPTTAATLNTIDGTLQKVSEQEVKILSKEIDNISTEVDATTTDTPDISGDQKPADTKTDTKAEVKGSTTATPTPKPTPVSP